MDPKEEWQIRSRIAELKKQKKKFMDTIRRKRKSLAKTQLKKKQAAKEETELRDKLGPAKGMPPKPVDRRSRPKTQDKFDGMDKDKAQALVTKEIDDGVVDWDISRRPLSRESDD